MSRKTAITRGPSRRGPADFVVAEAPLDQRGGHETILMQFGIWLCALPPDTPVTCLVAPDHLDFSPITAAGAGSTIWTDSHSRNFDHIVGEITDGNSDVMSVASDILGWAFNKPEPEFFGAQAGPNGIDLAGYAISRIGFRVDDVSLVSPGGDPNGNGIWTDWRIRGTFLFEGTLASKDVCKNGGWQRLHRPDGTSFRNEGDCIQFFNTGK
jgi:hypothetical protein